MTQLRPWLLGVLVLATCSGAKGCPLIGSSAPTGGGGGTPLNLPEQPPTPPGTPDSTNAFYRDGDPVVDFQGNSPDKWSIQEDLGKATYKPFDWRIELKWALPPDAIYVGRENTLSFGGKIMTEAEGPHGTSIHMVLGTPLQVEGTMPEKFYIGRSGSDGKLYPNPEGSHEDTRTFKFKLPASHGLQTCKIEVHLGYGPIIIYNYKQ